MLPDFKRESMKDYSNEWLTLVNRALAMIGSQMLVSFSDGTEAANFSKPLLDEAIELTYSALQRPDLARYQQLPMVSVKNKGNYLYSYAKPESIVRIIDVIPKDAEWEMTADAILSNSDTLTISYITLPDKSDDVPVYARQLIVYKLAALLAKPVAHDENLAVQMENLFSSELSRAISFAPKFRNQPDYGKDSWL